MRLNAFENIDLEGRVGEKGLTRLEPLGRDSVERGQGTVF